jgi:O-antigen/teichoic acid export membrane protein
MPKLFAKFYNLFFGDRLYFFNIAATFGAQFVTAVSVLILMPKLLDALGEQQFAVYGIILNAIIFGGMFDFGMNIGLLRRIIHENNNSNSLMTMVFTFYIIIFLIATPFLFILHSTSNIFISGLTLFQLGLLCLLVLQNLLATLFDIVIQSTQKIFRAKMIRMVKILAELFTILLVVNKGSLNAILVCMIFFNLLYILALRAHATKIVGARSSLFLIDLRLLKSHLKYSFWYFLAALSTILVFNTQLFVLDLMAGPNVVTQFVLFNRFFEIMRFAISNFTAVLQPAIVVSEINNPIKVKQMYLTSLKRVLLLLLLVFLVLNQWGFEIFMWWSKYRR